MRSMFKRHGGRLIAILTGGLIGLGLVLTAGASSYSASSEAETGTITLPAVVKSSPSASGGSAVQFGAATPAHCQGPLTITSGGTYTGCYESTSSTTPAIKISTTQPVLLTAATIRHAGPGLEQGTSQTNITVSNSSFTAIAPSAARVEQQAIRLYMPASLVIEHNRFVNGHGVQINGNNAPTSPLRIAYNDYLDISRLSLPEFYQGAVHTDKVVAPGGKIVWNRVVNHHGKSQAEDVFGLASTKGAPGNPIEVAYNLVNGAYPMTGDGAGFTGGAFDFADIGGGYIDGHHNYAVNYTNNGFMIPAGTSIRHSSSVAVYDGIADDGARVSSKFGNGFTTYQGYETPATDIVINGARAAHRRWTGSAWERADYYLPFGTNTANVSLAAADAAAEQAAIDEFEQLVIANRVTIGPM